jgi:drug/metabolite transporter (DMT)-like permease
MSWVLLTLLAIISRAVYSIATKLLSKHVEVSPVTQAVLLTTFAGFLALIASPFIDGLSFVGISDYWLVVVVMIMSQAFGNILFFLGVKRLDTGTAQIAFSSILVWGALLSIVFLNSSFTLIQTLGIVLMLVAIVLVQYKRGRRKIDAGVLYIITAAVLFAIFQVASADLAKTLGTGAYLVLAYLGSSVVLSIIYAKTLRKDWKKLQKQLRCTFRSTIFASSTSFLYFLFSYFAYQEAPDRGVVVVLLTAQVILSVILGIVFLKERENMSRKLSAGLLAFIAGILIKS